MGPRKKGKEGHSWIVWRLGSSKTSLRIMAWWTWGSLDPDSPSVKIIMVELEFGNELIGFLL